jgi:hypothetical protein
MFTEPLPLIVCGVFRLQGKTKPGAMPYKSNKKSLATPYTLELYHKVFSIANTSLYELNRHHKLVYGRTIKTGRQFSKSINELDEKSFDS